MMTHIRPHTLAPGGLLLPGLGLLLMSALVAAEAGAAPVERDEICQGYRGTALWGECTRAVDNGCHESVLAHRQCARWEAQWEAQTGAPPPWLRGCGVSSKCVFVTSEAYTGDLGGLSGADDLCQARAGATGSQAAPGNYRAWLSSTTVAPFDRFEKAINTPYELVDGTKVADDYEHLTSPTEDLSAAIDTDEKGNQVIGRVWTNTTESGQVASLAPSSNCQQWSSSAHFDLGVTGDTRLRQEGWTRANIELCDLRRHLYCFQQ